MCGNAPNVSNQGFDINSMCTQGQRSIPMRLLMQKIQGGDILLSEATLLKSAWNFSLSLSLCLSLSLSGPLSRPPVAGRNSPCAVFTPHICLFLSLSLSLFHIHTDRPKSSNATWDFESRSKDTPRCYCSPPQGPVVSRLYRLYSRRTKHPHFSTWARPPSGCRLQQLEAC